ncbi:MAG: hypothetical protein WC607_02445 [Candidatus Micrarchaeia archaeon]
MKKAFGLLAVCLLLFGCVGGGSTANNTTNHTGFGATPEAGFGSPSEEGPSVEYGDSESQPQKKGPSDASPIWEGTFTVHFYGGGAEKAYDMTLTAEDQMYFDYEAGAFDVMMSTYHCVYSETSNVEMGGGMPPITMSRTGSGSINQEYPESEYRILVNDDGSVSGDFSEPRESWVDFAVTFNSESSTETGGCLIEDFGDILFTESDYTMSSSNPGTADSISGSKSFSTGTANAEVTFEYHRV